jgi:imidazolonepropionase-like amidohydrolase
MAGVLFHGGRIIDGSGGSPLDDGAVLVEDDTITWTGPSRSAPLPAAGVAVVDLAGATLLPGFIDCHVHLAWPGRGGFSLFEPLRLPTSLRLLSILRNMRATIEAGVTTVRDCMGLDLGFKQAVEQGLVAGPRVLFSATMMSSTGGHADFQLPNGFDPWPHLVAPDCVSPHADGPDECRRKTREMIRAGSDFIKVSASGGVSSPTDEPDWPGYTVEELSAVVDEAAARGGRVVAAHCLGREGIRRALEAGISSIEHGVDLTDELCDEMARRAAFLVPTAVMLFCEMDPSVVLPSTYEQYLEWVGIGREALPRAVHRGVTIAMGTDCGIGIEHGKNLQEIVRLVQFGMRPMDAIVAATSTASRLLGLDDAIGTLTEGKQADLVVVDADPLDDISILARSEHLRLVMKGGKTYKGGAAFGLEGLAAKAP